MGWISDIHGAVIARARAGDGLADKIWVSETEEGDPRPLPMPYIMIFADNGQYTSDMIVQHNEKVYMNYTVHFVAETHDQVNWLADRFYAQWLGWRPEIEGFKAFKMVANFSTPDNTNDSVHPPLLYRVDEWGLRLVKGKVSLT